MEDKIELFSNVPLIALIHNISKNQIKYLKSRIGEYGLGREIRYVMMVYDNPGCSQDDLVNIYGESKANVAKALRKLEDEGFIEREVNPDNRRKYMLRATSKAEELVPKVRQISKDWEREVGIDELDFEFTEKLRQIAIKGMKLK